MLASHVNSDTKEILAILERLVQAHQHGVFDWIGLGAIVLTLAVLVWYTIETYYLRIAAVRQLDVASTPILMIAPVARESESTSADITIRNVGTGPAFNISVKAADLPNGATLIIDYTDVLAGQETQKIVMLLRIGNESYPINNQADINGLLRQGHLHCPIAVTITYTSTAGKHYRTKMSIELAENVCSYQFCAHSEVKG